MQTLSRHPKHLLQSLHYFFSGLRSDGVFFQFTISMSYWVCYSAINMLSEFSVSPVTTFSSRIPTYSLYTLQAASEIPHLPTLLNALVSCWKSLLLSLASDSPEGLHLLSLLVFSHLVFENKCF